jgi:hypothetical protein
VASLRLLGRHFGSHRYRTSVEAVSPPSKLKGALPPWVMAMSAHAPVPVGSLMLASVARPSSSTSFVRANTSLSIWRSMESRTRSLRIGEAAQHLRSQHSDEAGVANARDGAGVVRDRAAT